LILVSWFILYKLCRNAQAMQPKQQLMVMQFMPKRFVVNGDKGLGAFPKNA